MSDSSQSVKQDFDWQKFENLMREKWETEHNPDENGFYEFPFDNFPITSFVLFVGPRRSGKGQTQNWMLFRLREKIHTCVVFCGSDAGDSAASRLVPDCFVYDAIDVNCLQALRVRYNNAKYTFEQTGKMPPFCKTLNVLIIADDVMHDKKKVGSDDFGRVILSGRHECQGLWVLLQYAPKFPKELRRQIDYVIIKEHATEAEYAYIHKEFASGIIRDFNEFYRLARFYTQNYGALVLKIKDADPNDVTTQLFYMRVPSSHDLPPFKLDAGTMFQMAKKHEKPAEQKGVIVNYNSKDIFDCKRICQTQSMPGKRQVEVPRKKGAGTTFVQPIFRMPS